MVSAETEQVTAGRGDGTSVPSGGHVRENGGHAARTDGAPAPQTRFDRLSPRHRDCLRGVRDLKGSKEIADALRIEKSTVDGYLTDAVKILGARNRRDAALQWAAHEAGPSPASHSETTIPAPDKIGGHSARLVQPALALPSAVSPDEGIVGASVVSGAVPSRRPAPELRLPFRRKGQRDNDLSVGDRLIWIQVIALGIAVGFGMLMSGLQVLTGLIEAVTQRLS
ncbi:helix-turn-helix transcriptional regulator [Sphingomonas sp. A2-49]|uniref:helix-turn-helix domain-containing protein n=1 Tax=Sphingomonas sp. A2-49 TaxID=1391375 RepID=UPI0021CED931|nr:helix-turn-helix transcriptional regulator [Sphingomonas sp. A2-49]MCU6454787.1 helix-turn-helix transcriptional regulator [Sphingomonas sp. A2-49]